MERKAETIQAIHRIIEDTLEYDAFGLHKAELCAAEIAKLFERKVIWEGEAYVDAFGRIRFLDPLSRKLPIPGIDDKEFPGEMFYPGLAAGKGSILGLAGKRVRVIVEDIEG